jgi:hypothetical protein
MRIPGIREWAPVPVAVFVIAWTPGVPYDRTFCGIPSRLNAGRSIWRLGRHVERWESQRK